jgi:mannose-6-phosphate isomerase-like protein (cupin superfamily)
MGYGLTLDQVTKVNRPTRQATPWGAETICTERPEYSLACVELGPGAAQPMHFHTDGWRRLFVERGDVLVRRLDEQGAMSALVVRQGDTLPIAPFEVHGFSSREGAELYLFGPPGSGARPVLAGSLEDAQSAVGELEQRQPPDGGEPTTNRLDKYWGTIETIVDDEVAGKRILVVKGGQSSMEFHVEKRETYWVRSGLLKVGLRVGRAENHSIVLGPGESYDIFPGVMHMRIALEDTVIIEASTRDSDADSHLVEDGQTYRHVEVAAH